MWFIWAMFMLAFLILPAGYGWGYRGWGPPYPTHIQRRRMQQAAAEGSIANNHASWRAFGDFVWFMVIVFTVWAVAGFFWWR